MPNNQASSSPPKSDRFSDRIWITRKSRIEAASRLEWNSVYSQFLLAYFAVFSVIFSILDIRDTTKDYSYQLLIASVITLSVSIFVPSMRFPERAGSFKKCYIALDGLYRRARRAERQETDVDSLEQTGRKIDAEYSQLMDNCENHSNADYLLAVWRIKDRADSTFELSKAEEFRVYIHKVVRFVVVVGLASIPILVLFSF